MTRTTAGPSLDRICRWTGPSLGNFTSAHTLLIVQAQSMNRTTFIDSASQVTGAVRVKGIGQVAYSASGPNTLGVWQQGISLTFGIFNVLSPVTKAKVLANAALRHL